jgi:hypothetical protein
MMVVSYYYSTEHECLLIPLTYNCIEMVHQCQLDDCCKHMRERLAAHFVDLSTHKIRFNFGLRGRCTTLTICRPKDDSHLDIKIKTYRYSSYGETMHFE